MPNPRFFPRRLAVTVCVGALVLGACGSDDSSTIEAGAPLPIGADRATGEATMAMDGAEEDMAWPGWVPIQFVAGDGLASLGDDRPAFVLVPDERQLTTVADRLGTTVVDFRDATPQDGGFREIDPEEPVGEPGPPDAVSDDAPPDDTISIGDGGLVGSGLDPDAPDPTVMTSDGAEWFYYDHRSDQGGLAVAECDADGVCTDNSRDTPTSTSAEEAETIARDLLDGIGPGLDGASIETEGAWGTWNVLVRYGVDGHEVDGLHASVTVGEGGVIVAAAGLTGTFDALGDYPTLDTAGAIDRMNDGWYTFGSDINTFGPRPMMSEPATAEAGFDAADGDVPEELLEAQTTTTSPPVPPDEIRDIEAEQAGDPSTTTMTIPDGAEPMPMPEPVEPVEPPDPVTVTVTDVAWGLSVFHAWDGSGLYVVPTYLFTGDDGNDYSVPAVTDDVIAPPDMGDEVIDVDVAPAPMPTDLDGSVDSDMSGQPGEIDGRQPDGVIEPGDVSEPNEGP